MTSAVPFVLQFLQGYWVELVCALVLVVTVPLIAGYMVLVERKLMVGRQGGVDAVPDCGGPHGLLQPFADVLKLFRREDTLRRDSDAVIFQFSPVLFMAAAFSSLAALYFGPAFRVARDINLGILFVVGVSSLGVLRVILGGWPSRARHSVAGALRSTAGLISYEAAAGLAIVSPLLLSGSLRIHSIVEAQLEHRIWFVFLAPVAFCLYFVASVARSNRARFGLPELESEDVAGHPNECNGFRGFLYFLGEYANILVAASFATTLFFGGWLRPFPNVRWLNWLDFLPAMLLALAGAYGLYREGKKPQSAQAWFLWAIVFACLGVALLFLTSWIFAPWRSALPGLNGAFWFLCKVFSYIYVFLWLRLVWPRYRFEELMPLAWNVLIPLAVVNVFFVAVAMLLEAEFGWKRWFAVMLTTVFTLITSGFLVHWHDKRIAGASSTSAVTSDSYAG
jgi:NADH-quinone oxidoreductase subunit H